MASQRIKAHSLPDAPDVLTSEQYCIDKAEIWEILRDSSARTARTASPRDPLGAMVVIATVSSTLVYLAGSRDAEMAVADVWIIV